jgi:hypothetical protein
MADYFSRHYCKGNVKISMDGLVGRQLLLEGTIQIVGGCMTKYGPKAQEKVAKNVKEMKKGTLKSSSGTKVTSRKQAVAIGLSEARKQGAKVPKKKS